MHPLAHRQRALGQVVQYPPDGLVGFGGGVGTAHLAEYLLLAHHGTVESAGHGKEMLDGGLAVADIGMLGQLAHGQPRVLSEHPANRRQSAVEGVHHGVDLDPVAGREHHDLGHQRGLQQSLDKLELIGLIGR